jgi:gas vesicle protein
MKEFVTGMVLGAVAGMATDMALHTKSVQQTKMGKTMQTVTDAVDSAAKSVQHTMDR